MSVSASRKIDRTNFHFCPLESSIVKSYVLWRNQIYISINFLMNAIFIDNTKP